MIVRLMTDLMIRQQLSLTMTTVTVMLPACVYVQQMHLTLFPIPSLDSRGKRCVANLCKNVRCVCVCVCAHVCRTERALITPSSPTQRASISQVCVIIVNTHPPKHPVSLNQKEHINAHVYTHTQTIVFRVCAFKRVQLA